LRCEVCGRRIVGKPFKAMIEGAKMLVCNECVKLGSIYWEEKTEPRLKKIARRLPTPIMPTRKQPTIKVEESIDLVENYGSKIRQAREKLGLSHEDLGRKISEKVSVLRKIESAKMTPDQKLAEKLQHALRIKLLAEISEPKVPAKALATPRPVTLGDIIQLRKKTKSGEPKREQS